MHAVIAENEKEAWDAAVVFPEAPPKIIPPSQNDREFFAALPHTQATPEELFCINLKMSDPKASEALGKKIFSDLLNIFPEGIISRKTYIQSSSQVAELIQSAALSINAESLVELFAQACWHGRGADYRTTAEANARNHISNIFGGAIFDWAHRGAVEGVQQKIFHGFDVPLHTQNASFKFFDIVLPQDEIRCYCRILRVEQTSRTVDVSVSVVSSRAADRKQISNGEVTAPHTLSLPSILEVGVGTFSFSLLENYSTPSKFTGVRELIANNHAYCIPTELDPALAGKTALLKQFATLAGCADILAYLTARSSRPGKATERVMVTKSLSLDFLDSTAHDGKLLVEAGEVDSRGSNGSPNKNELIVVPLVLKTENRPIAKINANLVLLAA